ncbi:LSU ribosomal protein L10P [Chthonomonas calidirosea]|uniref:50S ribosomal protein L10 n=1 Tax=Chthonomonas calidirosea TaxID=454171 RepID=UPI0006DD4346|nr:50S ribosomal protein L10 [Chthonomonas calidirosea]CEK16231.1 LSU ribosomal protein L10P [Chthonomonas calidirosea]
MPNPEKVQKVEELRQLIAQSDGAILTEYRGLTVAEITALRKRLRETGGEYHVVKNTLFKLALGHEQGQKLDQLLQGPTAIVFSTRDLVATAKATSDFFRELRRPGVQIKAGWIDGKVYSAEQVAEIAKLPPKEQIVAQLIGSLNAPASNFVGTLNNIIGEFVRTVQAIADKKAAA